MVCNKYFSLYYFFIFFTQHKNTKKIPLSNIRFLINFNGNRKIKKLKNINTISEDEYLKESSIEESINVSVLHGESLINKYQNIQFLKKV